MTSGGQWPWRLTRPQPTSVWEIAYERMGQIQEAAGAFKEAVRLDPQDAAANYSLGVTLQKLGSHTEAAAALKRATELQKDWAEAFHFLGIAYDNLGDHENSLAAAKEAARLKPNDVVILIGLGYALRANGKYGSNRTLAARCANAA